MSNDRSLRNGEIIFSKGSFVDLYKPDDMTYSAVFPMDGHELKEITSGFESWSLCVKNLGGHLQSGELRIPFESICELEGFLDYVDEVIAQNAETVSIEKIHAALELEGCSSIAEAQHVVDCIDDFDFIGGIESYEELGMYLLKNLIPNEMYLEIEDVLDAEKYGQNYANCIDYFSTFASTGFIKRLDEFEPLYDPRLEQTM